LLEQRHLGLARRCAGCTSAEASVGARSWPRRRWSLRRPGRGSVLRVAEETEPVPPVETANPRLEKSLPFLAMFFDSLEKHARQQQVELQSPLLIPLGEVLVVVCVVEALQRVALQMDIVLADNQRRVNRSDYVLRKHFP